MKSRDFCYWLQGMFELGQPTTLNSETVNCIRNHLNMVFLHEIDPSFPTSQKIELDKSHSNKPNTSGYNSLPNDATMRC